MKKLLGNKIMLVVSAFVVSNIFINSDMVLKLKIVSAQHTDVFNLDKDKLPKRVEPDAPETEWIVVEDRVRYDVAVDKSKYEAGDLQMENIQLWEIVDKSPFEWHQVEYYLEGDIVETHIRTFGKQECGRSRKGTLFWLKDGKKCAYWGAWAVWDCRSEAKRGEDYLVPQGH